MAVSTKDKAYGRWTREDFKKLAYDPFILPVSSNNYLNKYPKLIEREIFFCQLDFDADKNKIICYMLLLYQIDSPLFVIDNILQRKIEAAKLAGFDLSDDKKDFTYEYKQVLFGRDKAANKMIFEFCRMQNNDDFTELMVYQEVFHDQLTIVQDRSSDPVLVQKALLNIDELKNKIKELKKSLVFDDQNEGLMQEVMEKIEMERIGLRREDVARKLLEKEDPLDGYTPYGNSFKIKLPPDINKQEYEKLTTE